MKEMDICRGCIWIKALSLEERAANILVRESIKEEEVLDPLDGAAFLTLCGPCVYEEITQRWLDKLIPVLSRL